MIHRDRATLRSFLAIVSLATFGISSAANADPMDEQESELYFVGFDSKVAAAHGYEIRVVDGYGWSVPANNSPTDTSGGVRGNPTHDWPTPQNTVYGNCGYSMIYYSNGFNGQFMTSYIIYSSYGYPIHHQWRVISATSTNLYSWNLDGYTTPSLGGWVAYRDLSGESGSRRYVQVIHGSVTTTSGSICTSGNPIDYP